MTEREREDLDIWFNKGIEIGRVCLCVCACVCVCVGVCVGVWVCV